MDGLYLSVRRLKLLIEKTSKWGGPFKTLEMERVRRKPAPQISLHGIHLQKQGWLLKSPPLMVGQSIDPKPQSYWTKSKLDGN